MIGPMRIRQPDTQIRQVGRGRRSTEVSVDLYYQRLVTLIPSEVIGLYIIGSDVIPEGHPAEKLGWALFCLIAVILLRTYATTDRLKRRGPQWAAVAISAVAFVVWAYSLGGPFKEYDVFVPHLASLAVLATSFLIPIVYSGQPDS